MPTIYVDADAVPRAIRDVLYRAAEKRGAVIVFVANSWMKVPGYGDISFVQVAQGPDEADNWIAEKAGSGDLVVTQDVPLAARVVPKGAEVVQTNGRTLDQESIDEALAMRDFAENLRDSGFQTGGPPPFSPKHKQSFSNALDRWLTRQR